MLFWSNPEWKNNPFLRDAFKEANNSLSPRSLSLSISSCLVLYDATWASGTADRSLPPGWPAAQSGRASVPGKRRRAIVIHQRWSAGSAPRPNKCNKSALMHLSAQQQLKPHPEGRSQISGPLPRWAVYCCFSGWQRQIFFFFWPFFIVSFRRKGKVLEYTHTATSQLLL